MQETQGTQFPSLAQEDPLKKEMANHSSILAWEIPWTEEPAGLQSMESQRVWQDWARVHMCTHVHTHTHTPLLGEKECSDQEGGVRQAGSLSQG